MDVLTSFWRTRYAQSTSEISAEPGLDRTSVRRVVRTLQALGYLEAVGTRYRLTAKVLDLGYAALAARDFSKLAQPYLEQVAESSGQSCSLGVLDGDATVCVARAAVRRVLSISLAPGSRVPTFASALGRALLSDVDDVQLRPTCTGCGERATPVAGTSTSITTSPVLDAIEQASWTRNRYDTTDLAGLVQHTDAGSTRQSPTPTVSPRPVSMPRSAPSATSTTRAETINGLYKTELVEPRKPWRTVEEVELATADWVDWFNHRRLYEHCGDTPPAERSRLLRSPPSPARR